MLDGIGRLTEILPGRDPYGRVASKLSLVRLSDASVPLHEELVRARAAPDLTRGTGGPFRSRALPLPPPLAGYDEDEERSLDASTQLYSRAHGPLPGAAPAAPDPEATVGAPRSELAPAAAAAIRAAAQERPPVPAREPSAGTRAWLTLFALLAATAAAAFGAAAFWT